MLVSGRLALSQKLTSFKCVNKNSCQFRKHIYSKKWNPVFPPKHVLCMYIMYRPLASGPNMPYDSMQQTDFAHSAHFLDDCSLLCALSPSVCQKSTCTEDHLRLIQQLAAVTWREDVLVPNKGEPERLLSKVETHWNWAQTQAWKQQTNKK